MAFSQALPTQLLNQTSPVQTAMQNIYNSNIAGAQSAYAPAQAQANAFLAQQQAKYLPYQYASNPLLWLAAQGNPALQEQLKNMVTSPLSGGNQPPPPSGGGMLNFLLDKLDIGGNSNNAMQQTPGSPQTGGNALLTAPTSSGAPYPHQNTIAMPSNMATAPNQTSSGTSTGNTVSPSPIVPATGGATQGAAASITAPYQQNPNPHGSLIPDQQNPGHVIATPDANTIATSEQTFLESKNLKPIIQELYDGSQKWLPSTGNLGKVGAAQKLNLFEQYAGNLFGIPEKIKKMTGMTNEDISNYANWKADQYKAINLVMKSRGWPENMVSQNEVAKIVTPLPGEGPEFGDRVVHDLAQIDAQVQNYKDALRNGVTSAPLSVQYPGSNQTVQAGAGAGAGIAGSTNNTANTNAKVYSEGKEPPADSIWMKRPDGQIVPVLNSRINEAKQYKFTEVE